MESLTDIMNVLSLNDVTEEDVKTWAKNTYGDSPITGNFILMAKAFMVIVKGHEFETTSGSKQTTNVEDLEKDKSATIEVLIAYPRQSSYMGVCPTCKRSLGKGVKVGSEEHCKKCGEMATAERAEIRKYEAGDRTGNITLIFFPTNWHDDWQLVGKTVTIWGNKREGNDFIVGSVSKIN